MRFSWDGLNSDCDILEGHLFLNLLAFLPRYRKHDTDPRHTLRGILSLVGKDTCILGIFIAINYYNTYQEVLNDLTTQVLGICEKLDVVSMRHRAAK